MRRFNGQVVESIMNRFNLPDDLPIDSGMVTKAIRSAQTQVEQQNFEIRKNVLKYDEVLNQQRTVVYAERRKVLAGEDIKEQVEHMLEDVIAEYVKGATEEGYAEDWDLDKLWTAVGMLYPPSIRWQDLADSDEHDDITKDVLLSELLADARDHYAAREREIDEIIGSQGGMRELERQVLLQVMDRKWREHLYEMDYLKEGIGLRAMAQRDPLIEYQREGFDMFAAMLEGIKEETVTHLFHVRVQAAAPAAPEAPAASEAAPAAAEQVPTADDSVTQTRPNPVVTPAAERTVRTPAGNGAGRHAAPEGDAAATTGVLPTVFGGSTTRRPTELQYSGPAEDGGTTTRRRATAPTAPGGRAAVDAPGGAPGEPARNRPCPCGSGRKYKHCHGAPTAAHS
jgi:preprotein translocase subunit SecA